MKFLPWTLTYSKKKKNVYQQDDETKTVPLYGNHFTWVSRKTALIRACHICNFH